MPLVAGRYPVANEEWMLDGQPFPPYRQSISRRDILSTGVTPTVNTVCVYPVVFQAGDIIGAISVGVKTATAATASHGWAALYTGLTTASTLIVQSADSTSGFTPSNGAQKFTLTTPFLVGGSPGSTGTTGPVVLGVALYNSSSGAGGALDGMSGSSVAGAVMLTGQLPFFFSVALSATATAPANLAGAAAATGGVPYIVCSKS
jgi:hypothetical protein